VFSGDRFETEERRVSRSSLRGTAQVHPEKVYLSLLISDRSIGNDLPTFIPLPDPEMEPLLLLKPLPLERFFEFKSQLLRIFFYEHVQGFPDINRLRDLGL